MFLRKLGIIVWKNLLLRKRQYIITSLEILIPVITALILVLISDPSYKEEYNTKPETVLEKDLLSKCESWCHVGTSINVTDSYFTAYMPETAETTRVVEKVMEELCRNSNGTIGHLPVANASDLEEKCRRNFYYCRAALVFPDELKVLKQGANDKNATINYEIRMQKFTKSNLLPERKSDQCLWSWPNDFTRLGPKNNHIKEDFEYIRVGFLCLQIATERVLTKMLTGETDWNNTISLRNFPHPPYLNFAYEWKQRYFRDFSIAFAFFMTLMIPSITRNVVGEKRSGMTELLRLAGVGNCTHSIGWLIYAIAPYLITVSLITIFFCAIELRDAAPLLENSDGTFVWVFQFISVVYVAAFFYLICSFFQKPVPAMIVTLIIWLLSGLLTFFLLLLEPTWFSKSELFACIFPVVPYMLAMKIIVDFDQTVVDDSEQPLGAHWYRIGEGCPWGHFTGRGRTQSATLLDLMIFQLVFTILYMLLGTYFECKLPSQYGERRPWKIFDCRRTKTEKSKWPLANDAGTVAVDIQHLGKRFGDKVVAVNGVSLQINAHNSFALLGDKGAGKTTLISMITGLISPTSGTVLIDGIDIRDDLDNAREKVGLCPQQNALFESLTVSENLWIFGMLAGEKMKEVKANIKGLLELMNFSEKANTCARKLSAGEKRKLGLGMALIGRKKVVVLDELTNGLDPEVKEEIWQIVTHFKKDHTFLLTTDSNQEAVVLGDRFGLMAGGVMQCVGTAESIGTFYGSGYKLKATLAGGDNEGDKVSTAPSTKTEPQSESDKIVETEAQVKQLSNEIKEATEALFAAVKKHVPDAALNTDVPSQDVVFMLPSETAPIETLGALVVDLAANRAKLKIKTIGLYHSSMENFFLKRIPLGQLSEGHVPEQEEIETGDGDGGVGAPNGETVKSPKVNPGFQLAFGRFTALLIKRSIYFIRKWGLLIFQILLPFALFMTIVHLTNEHAEPRGGDSNSNSTEMAFNSTDNSTEDVSSPSTNPDCEIPMNLDSYENPITLYNATSKHEYVKDVIGPSAQYYGHVVDDLLVKAERDIKEYRRHYIVALDVNRQSNPPEVIAMYSTYPYHSAPLAINLASNVILKYLDPTASRTIRLTSRPFGGCDEDESSSQNRRESRNVSGKRNALYRAQKLMTELLPLALLIFVTCCIIVPIEEKICRVKQLQIMSGGGHLFYWGSFFTFDYFIYFLVALLMLIYMLIFDWNRVWTSGAGPAVFLLIVMIYGFAGILFSYLLSLRAGSEAGGFVLVMVIHVFTGLFWGLVFRDPDYNDVIFLIIILICRLFPTYSLTRALIRYGYIAIRNSNCRLLEKCKTGNTPYLTWTMSSSLLQTADEVDLLYYRPVEVPGILQDLAILFLMGVLYGVLLLINEYKLWRYLSPKSSAFDNPSMYPLEDDVQSEVNRVDDLVMSGYTNQDCLLVKHLSKSYGNFAAVKRVSFGVHYGECFGLVGVNGAGKTTVFRMLTGDETPTAGEAYGFDTSLSRTRLGFISNIGYCPQFGGILPDLKGIEVLQLFAGLRGVPSTYKKIWALKWLKRVGLLESAYDRCKNYSGGMKRRLTIAMALIGDPDLILLDEPTSGMDPVSRRQFWKILDKCKVSGQSVILTSHSMEECKALCSRLAIMVNGEFQCFGEIQELKNKFSQGYSLFLKLKTEQFPENSTELRVKIKGMNDKVTDKFERCVIEDKHRNMMEYHLELEHSSSTWDALLKGLEELKSEYEDFIEDFAVNETSLEETFLHLARAQHPENRGHGKAKAKCLKRYLTCRC